MDGRTVSAIERGLCVLVGLHREDTSEDIDYACVPTRGAGQGAEREKEGGQGAEREKAGRQGAERGRGSEDGRAGVAGDWTWACLLDHQLGGCAAA